MHFYLNSEQQHITMTTSISKSFNYIKEKGLIEFIQWKIISFHINRTVKRKCNKGFHKYERVVENLPLPHKSTHIAYFRCVYCRQKMFLLEEHRDAWLHSEDFKKRQLERDS